MCLRAPQHERSCQLSLEQKLQHVWMPIVPCIQSPPSSFVVPLLAVRAPLDCLTVLKCSEFLSQLLATWAESRGKASTLGRRGAQPAVNPSRATCWRASPPDSPVRQWSGSQLISQEHQPPGSLMVAGRPELPAFPGSPCSGAGQWSGSDLRYEELGISEDLPHLALVDSCRQVAAMGLLMGS